MEKSLYLHKILNRCERQKKLRKIYFYSVLFMVFVLVNVLFFPIYSNVFNFVFNSIDENINQVELDYTYQEELINDNILNEEEQVEPISFFDFVVSVFDEVIFIIENNPFIYYLLILSFAMFVPRLIFSLIRY